MPRKRDIERPVKVVHGVNVLIMPDTHETKKGRHRHYKDGTPKKDRGRPRDVSQDILIEEEFEDNG